MSKRKRSKDEILAEIENMNDLVYDHKDRSYKEIRRLGSLMKRPFWSKLIKFHVSALIALVIGVVLLQDGSESETGSEGDIEEPQQEEREVFGTNGVITIHDSTFPEDAIDRYFERAEQIQDTISRNEEVYDDTEILTINRNAGEEPVEVSDDTFFLVSEGMRLGEMTDGVFDITAEPLVELWDIGGPNQQVPSEAEREETLSLVNFEEIELDEAANTVYLPREGMGVDLGSIAKGYAIDEIAGMMREDGIESAIIDFGGDLYNLGARPDGTEWTIGIQHPSGESERILATISSTDDAIATSGTYEREFEEDGVRYHHILDVGTGAPSDSGLVSTTVVGPQATAADALSKTVLVMGLEDGYEFIEDLDDYEGVFADDDGGIYATPGIHGDLEVGADDFELLEYTSDN